MKEDHEATRDKAWDDPFERIEFLIRNNPWTWQSVGAVSGLAGGILAPALGTLSTVVRWFTGVQRASSYLNRLSIVLFALIIPLLALGAHCLDLLEAKTTPPSPSVEPLFVGVALVGAGARIAHRNGKQHPNKTGTLAVLILLLALPASNNAQQTISNIPTTDVLPPCKGCVEPSISAKLIGPEAQPSPSPSPSEYEPPQRTRIAPFAGVFPRAEYIGPVFEPVTGVRNYALIRPSVKTIWDGATAQGAPTE